MAIGKVNRVSNITTSPSVSSVTNTSKNLQSQLMVKQQNLKKLSTDSQLSAEEKEKQRQELEKEIAELKRRLEQLKLKSEETEKVEKEVQLKGEVEKTSEEKEYKAEGSISLKNEEDEKAQAPISAEDAEKMLHHNYFLKEEMVQQGVAYDKENLIRVMSAEIHQDEIRGVDTSSQKEQLKEMQENENFWVEAKNKNAEQEIPSVVNPDAQVVIS